MKLPEGAEIAASVKGATTLSVTSVSETLV